MKMIFKKIFKMLAASVNILFIGFVTVLVLNLIEYFCPVLYWIIGIGVLFVAGYLFGNEFKWK